MEKLKPYQSGWISVDERLPQDKARETYSDNILACTSSGFCFVAFFSHGSWRTASGDVVYAHTITHWMPLPELPEPPEDKR